MISDLVDWHKELEGVEVIFSSIKHGETRDTEEQYVTCLKTSEPYH